MEARGLRHLYLLYANLNHTTGWVEGKKKSATRVSDIILDAFSQLPDIVTARFIFDMTLEVFKCAAFFASCKRGKIAGRGCTPC